MKYSKGQSRKSTGQKRDVSELEHLVTKFYDLPIDDAPLAMARLTSIKLTIELYALVGKKFTKRELDHCIDTVLKGLPDYAARRRGHDHPH